MVFEQISPENPPETFTTHGVCGEKIEQRLVVEREKSLTPQVATLTKLNLKGIVEK